jgi:hypothetical protein
MLVVERMPILPRYLELEKFKLSLFIDWVIPSREKAKRR